MNEEKNIETCLAESILADVASVPQDPQFRSLVEESFDPLQQQALQQAGCDAYKEVVMYHQPYTFTSQVRQMKSNLILLLRRLWRFPFGRGTIRSFADMWSHYITRLSGNPEYGIPSRLSSLTDLPSAPLLLSDRKISEPNAIDGISLVHLLCIPASITELTDDNVDWTMIRSLPNIFPNLRKATLACKEINPTTFTYSHNYLLPKTDVEYHILSKKITPKESGIGYIQSIVNGNQSKDVYCPELEEIGSGDRFGFVGDGMTAANISLDKKYAIYAPKVRKCAGPLFNSYGENQYTCVYRVVLGKIETNNFTPYQVYRTILFTPYLIDFEFGQGTDVSLNLGYWNPSYILSDNPTGTDLIEEGSTAQNNLQQFLQNFKTYIAERLTDQGSGLTLTLSQAVRNAIHAAESTYGIENIIITQKGWTISPAPN